MFSLREHKALSLTLQVLNQTVNEELHSEDFNLNYLIFFSFTQFPTQQQHCYTHSSQWVVIKDLNLHCHPEEDAQEAWN